MINLILVLGMMFLTKATLLTVHTAKLMVVTPKSKPKQQKCNTIGMFNKESKIQMEVKRRTSKIGFLKENKRKQMGKVSLVMIKMFSGNKKRPACFRRV